jgi:hypothetical protein
MDDWAVGEARRDGRGYREKMFKDGGGKVAFFELEDLTGRVNVKVRGARSRRTRRAHAGEPVSSRAR